MFSAHTQSNVTTFTHFCQSQSLGCLLALHGTIMHPAQICGGFRNFFLLSVSTSCYMHLTNQISLYEVDKSLIKPYIYQQQRQI